MKGVKILKKPSSPIQGGTDSTRVGKAGFKQYPAPEEDSLWRQTTPLGRYSIWNPRVQLYILWVRKVLVDHRNDRKQVKSIL